MTLEMLKEHCQTEEGGCLEWHGPARVRVNGQAVRPARAALLLGSGYTRPDRLPWRKCGNPICVNPEHLEPISRREWGRRHAGNLAPPFPKGSNRPPKAS